MKTQNLIKRTLSEPASIECICGLLEGNQIVHRNKLAELVCEQFGFFDARGREQRSGCLKALRELEGAGHFVLPAARGKTGRSSPRRLCEPVAAPINVPDRAFSGVAKGDWPKVKAYYRMIDQPDESAVDMPNILLPHRERTIRRMQGQKTVLCVQDGSDLNYNSLDKCKDLGEIGTNQSGAKSRGLHLHSTLAVAPNGLPLGVLRAQCIARQGKSPQEDRPAFKIPIEQKNTFTWIEHHRDLVELAARMPHTRLIEVCDREADFFELFDEQRQNSRVDLLLRAKNNRNIAEEPFKLFAAVGEEPVQSRVRVHIPRQSEAKKTEGSPQAPRAHGGSGGAL